MKLFFSKNTVIMQRGSADKKRKLGTAAAAALLIFLQLCFSTYFFAVEKQDYHMDELWSYGLANSADDPHLYARDGHDEWNLYGEWIDGTIFENYLTVQNGERFNYKAVYHNQAADVHPPVYYFILHTVCSFFPDSFSPWQAFAINALSFVGGQIFLWLIVQRLTRCDFAAFAVCAAWGFTTACVSCVVYLRMYALVLFITLAFMYLLIRQLLDGFSAKRLALLCALTYIGSLTQYFFIVFAGAVSVCVCVYYLIRKEYRHLFAYAGFMLLSVGLAVLTFPAMLSHMFADNNSYMGLHATLSKHPTIALQLHFILRYMIDELCGADLTLEKGMGGTYFLAAFVALTALAVPLCVLFRKEVWFKSASAKLRTAAAVVWRFIKKAVCSKRFAIVIITAAGIFGVMFANALVSPIAFMQEISSHYSVQVYPLVFVVIFCAVFIFVEKLPFRGRAVGCVLVLSLAVGCVCGSLLDSKIQYLYKPNNTTEKRLSEMSVGEDFIVVAGGGSDIQIYPAALYRANRILVLEEKEDEYKRFGNEVAAAAELDEIYLIVSEKALKGVYAKDSEEISEITDYTVSLSEDEVIHNEITEFILSQTGFENCDYLGSEEIYTYPQHIFRLS